MLSANFTLAFDLWRTSMCEVRLIVGRPTHDTMSCPMRKLSISAQLKWKRVHINNAIINNKNPGYFIQHHYL